VRAHIGDRIVVESERVAQPPRRGVHEEIIADEPPRLYGSSSTATFRVHSRGSETVGTRGQRRSKASTIDTCSA